MKNLNVNQMEDVNAGGDAVGCGIGVGLMVGTGFSGIGALIGAGMILLFCLHSDTHQQ